MQNTKACLADAPTSEVLLQLGFPVGIGAAGEFVAGYAAKKIGKLVAVIVGLFTAAPIYLSVKGIISMNYETLWNSLARSDWPAWHFRGLSDLYLPFHSREASLLLFCLVSS
jgi:uncharacterized membrane protein (Fun14 family)